MLKSFHEPDEKRQREIKRIQRVRTKKKQGGSLRLWDELVPVFGLIRF